MCPSCSSYLLLIECLQTFAFRIYSIFVHGSVFSSFQVPLCDRLDKYAEDPSLTSKTPNVVHFPPDFEPIPAKPLFFDLALSHVEFPSLDDKLEQKKQQGGLTGFVKGWLGGWGGKK